MSNTPSISVRVARKTNEAQDICSFELVAADGAGLPAFSAGSHVDVQLPNGLIRQYSLCNDPTESHRYLICVLLDPVSRGGSKAMHELQVGQQLQISAPKNHFPLAHEAKRHLLLAGGIGVTPILCMAERLAHSSSDFEMHYCTRSEQRTAFRKRIGDSIFAFRVQFHFDDGTAGQQLDLATLLATPESGVHLYVCGPKGFMDAVLHRARDQGWLDSQIHFEFFAGEQLASASDAGFSVQLASSGRVIQVLAQQTVTQALALAGVAVPTSCEQGVCGTCLTRVIEGIPAHRDCYLSPEEQAANDQFLPCCSRAKTALLVLDI